METSPINRSPSDLHLAGIGGRASAQLVSEKDERCVAVCFRVSEARTAVLVESRGEEMQ